MIFPPDTTSLYTNTKNDNPPKNNNNRGNKSLKFCRLSRGSWKKQVNMETGQPNTKTYFSNMVYVTSCTNL